MLREVGDEFELEGHKYLIEHIDTWIGTPGTEYYQVSALCGCGEQFHRHYIASHEVPTDPFILMVKRVQKYGQDR